MGGGGSGCGSSVSSNDGRSSQAPRTHSRHSSVTLTAAPSDLSLSSNDLYLGSPAKKGLPSSSIF